MYNRVALKEY